MLFRSKWDFHSPRGTRENHSARGGLPAGFPPATACAHFPLKEHPRYKPLCEQVPFQISEPRLEGGPGREQAGTSEPTSGTRRCQPGWSYPRTAARGDGCGFSREKTRLWQHVKLRLIFC